MPPSPLRAAVTLALIGLCTCTPTTPTPLTPTSALGIAPTSLDGSRPEAKGQADAIGAVTDAPVDEEDPVPSGLTVEGEKSICDKHVATATTLLAGIRAQKAAPTTALTYENTLGRLDRIALELGEAGELPYLMAMAHPDAAVREAARLCEPKIEAFNTALYLDEAVAAVMRAYAAKNEMLSPDRKRQLDELLRDFRRNGLELSADKQQRLRTLNEDIIKLGQAFEANIASAVGRIEVRPSQLGGLPPDYIEKHPPLPNGRVAITTDYPDYVPFVTYAHDRRAALELFIAFTNRGGEENVRILERLLAARSEKAKLLGYPTWAEYAVEPRMAKSPRAVREFLAQVRDAVRAPAKAEFSELMRVHLRTGGHAKDQLTPPDRYYLADRVRADKFRFDSKEIANYFEVPTVIQGLLDVTAAMYGLEYKVVPAHAWHPDVTAYEVRSEGKVIGKFYLDLFSREDKYKHAAMFPIRSGTRLPNGRTLLPIAALECNFPKFGAGPGPALMSHDDVVTFFHEFGHVLHHVLSRSELATYWGTNTARDFVEAPSQMFEEWAWSKDVLDRFARHHQTKAKIPDALFKAMKAARGFGRALDTQRQLFLATLDQELHSRPTGFDSTQVVEEAQSANESFVYVKGTHFQSTFGHLVSYDAGYYGYQWALAISRDVLTRFKSEGLMNPKTAAAFRDEVLAKGGGADERGMIQAFLGRPPSNDAYFTYLQGKD